jgi:hypothetical protein
MLDLGTTDFYIAVPSMPRQEFEKYSTRLFDEWDGYVEKTLTLPDYSLVLQVEEGSVRGVAKIAAYIGVVYIAIGNYGSFISGVQTIREQISTAGDFLANRAALPFDSSGVKPRVRKNGGSLARLQRLFHKVQRGEMTAEQAMSEAEVFLGDEAATSPEFMQKLAESLEQAPRFHQQVLLPLDALGTEDSLPSSGKGQLPRTSPKRPYLPPPSQFRVEVWRESKKGPRKIRVVQL